MSMRISAFLQHGTSRGAVHYVFYLDYSR